MSIFWRYVRVQLMTFVFGIVGPIFLIIYLAGQFDPTLKWMYWFGLFITAADVLIALAITNGSARSEPAGTSGEILAESRIVLRRPMTRPHTRKSRPFARRA